MITKVIIENFQSHKKTEVDFIAGTNVILGESDTGKSVIFRAINWVVSNRPLGDAFRSEWGGNTRVVLYTSDDRVIERVKTASRNEYIIDGKVLTAFGTEVPQEITDALQLDAFNIQAQWDSPFLLFNTPGEAARTLNKAASLDDIDRTISGLKKSLTRTESNITRNEGELERYKEALAEYNNLEEIERLILQVEQQDEEQSVVLNQRTLLQRLILKIHNTQDLVNRLSHVPDLLEKVETVEGWVTDVRRDLNKRQRLIQIVDEFTQTTIALESTEHITDALTVLRQAEQVKGALDVSLTRFGQLQRLSNRVRLSQAASISLTRDINKLEEEYKRIAPDTCPLCGAEMGREP